MPQRKCDRLSDILRNQIVTRQLVPGSKLMSESELCFAYDMSRQAVRQAIEILRNERLVQTIQGSGTYVSGDSPAEQRSSSDISVILPFDDDYIFGSIISGIQSTLSKRGYVMQMFITHNSRYEEEAALTSVLNKPPAGIIIDPAKSLCPRLHDELYQRIKDMEIPCISMNCPVPGFDFPQVSMDDVASGEIATNYLISNGHRNICFLCNSDSTPGQLRRKGFLREMSKHGLSELVWDTINFSSDDEADLFSGMFDELILRRFQNCTAAICFNDRVAAKLVNLLELNGIHVPEDVSIIGNDAALISEYVTPKLTTIRHFKNQVGAAAADNLIKLIADPNYNATQVFVPELVIRDSVRSIRN